MTDSDVIEVPRWWVDEIVRRSKDFGWHELAVEGEHAIAKAESSDGYDGEG